MTWDLRALAPQGFGWLNVLRKGQARCACGARAEVRSTARRSRPRPGRRAPLGGLPAEGPLSALALPGELRPRGSRPPKGPGLCVIDAARELVRARTTRQVLPGSRVMPLPGARWALVVPSAPGCSGGGAGRHGGHDGKIPAPQRWLEGEVNGQYPGAYERPGGAPPRGPRVRRYSLLPYGGTSGAAGATTDTEGTAASSRTWRSGPASKRKPREAVPRISGDKELAIPRLSLDRLESPETGSNLYR
jgi:hypothetical protein